MIKTKPILVISLLLHPWIGPFTVSAGEQADLYPRRIRPLLARHCFSCHGKKKASARLNLEAITRSTALKPGRWQHVRDRLANRQMPPLKHSQPTSEERRQLVDEIDRLLESYTLGGYRDPGPLRPRRLNVREYMNSLRDLVVSLDRPMRRRVSYSKTQKQGRVRLQTPQEHPCAVVAITLPQDTTDGGFDTVGGNLSIPPYLLKKYLRCTDLVLDDLFSEKGKDRFGRYQYRLRKEVERTQRKPLPRGIKSHRQAIEMFLAQFAARAFRRPVSTGDVQRYMALFDLAQKKGAPFEEAIRLPLQAILVSPRFVVLWADHQVETKATKAAPVRLLDGHELVSRLSYFLWSTVPDRQLRTLALQGKANDPEVIEREVRRMLNDQRIADGLLTGFLHQWLQMDLLAQTAPDADRYPKFFQDNLDELMRRELALFVEAVMSEDRSILEFIDADWGFLCRPLADHYDIKDFPGKRVGRGEGTWYRWKYQGKRRGGVLTMGMVLTGTSQPRRTSPVARGKWILETFLGAPPPPPPRDVDNVLAEGNKENKNLTVRQLMEHHRKNPACASCHRLIDPIGLTLENFDPTGKWRAKDQGQAIDSTGILTDGTKVNGILDLKSVLLARKETFTRCFVEHMLTYALGRKLEFYDAKSVRDITRAVAKDGYRFSRVVVEVAKSYPFRYCRTKEGGR